MAIENIIWYSIGAFIGLVSAVSLGLLYLIGSRIKKIHDIILTIVSQQQQEDDEEDVGEEYKPQNRAEYEKALSLARKKAEAEQLKKEYEEKMRALGL